MSFVEQPSLTRRQRFSLLLLEPSEIYFEDYSVFCETIADGEDDRREKGRLKICSKSVVFDPLDIQRPVLRIPFRFITQLYKTKPDKGGENDVLRLCCTQAIEMRENNTIGPYHIKTDECVFQFSSNYVSLDTFLPKLLDLWDISSLYPALMGEQLQQMVEAHRGKAVFDRNWLESLYEDIVVSVNVEQVSALTTNPGRLVLTNAMLYFQPFNNIHADPVQKYKLGDLVNLVNRRYLLKEKGLELFFMLSKSLFFSFEAQNDRDRFVVLLSRQPSVTRLEPSNRENMIQKWQDGEIDNFTYLLYLNSVADRSFNDLTQYPVFPWVLKDYTSKRLDLQNPATFRNLTKPIGALNAERLNGYKERYADMPDPKYFYATHYSTPGYVLYYLVRVAPEYMLCLQSGKFDQPDRLFNDIAATWKGVNTSHTDLKELIPEFYMPNNTYTHARTQNHSLTHASVASEKAPGADGQGEEAGERDSVDSTGPNGLGSRQSSEFLLNSQHLALGRKQDGTVINDVVLPPWAVSPEDFVLKCREALECDYVSSKLHHWIDLIFGYKQRGEEAVKAHNVFHYLSYEGTVDLDSIEDPHEKEATTMQILEFGQTPKQLFNIPHPSRRRKRHSKKHEAQMEACIATQSSPGPGYLPGAESGPQQLELQPGELESLIVSPFGSPSKLIVDEPLAPDNTVAKDSIYSSTHTLQLTNVDNITVAIHSLHQGEVTDVCFDTVQPDVVYSVGADSTLKAFSVSDNHQLRSLLVCELRLSCCVTLPETDYIVLGAWDNRLYFYSKLYGRVVNRWNVHDDSVSCVRARKNTIVTGSWDSTVKVWSGWGSTLPSDPKPYLQMEMCDHLTEISALDVDGSAKTLVSASVSGEVILYKLDLDNVSHVFPMLQFQAHHGTVNAVALTDNGEIMVSCGVDKQLCAWSVEDGALLFTASLGCVYTCLTLSGLIVLCGTDSGYLHAWDIAAHARLFVVQVHPDPLSSLTISECGTQIVCAVSSGDIAIIKIK